MAAEPSERKGADASASAMPAAAGPEPGADGRAQGAEDAPPHDPGEHKRGAEGSHLPGEKPDKVFCVELTNQVVLQKLRDFNERIEKLENEVMGVNTKAERNELPYIRSLVALVKVTPRPGARPVLDSKRYSSKT